MRRTAYFAVAVIAFFLVWWAIYPDRYDAKNPHYVLWKHHLLPMDLDRAAANVEIDRDRDAMLLGQTKGQLEGRFGYLKSPANVRSYLRDYCLAARPDADAMFLRNLDVMIVFTDGRAKEIVTCKG